MSKRSLSFLVLLSVTVLLLWGCGPGGPGSMTSGNPQQQNTTQFLISTIWFFVLGMIGYFFLVTRPALQKEEGQKKFVSELKKGDEVLSSGGIYGKIHATGGDLVTVEIAPNVRIRVKSDQITPYIKPSGQEGDGKKGAIES